MRAPAWVLALLRRPELIRLVDRLGLSHPPRDDASAHVLIAPPGRGNIGDQALVEAFVEAVEGPVRVVVRSREDFAVPADLAGRMSLVPLPALVYGTALGRARDLRALSRELDGARSFTVVGADVMDGAYVERASVGRSLLARRAAELGFDSRIAGFSWNATPRAGAKAALQAAARSGAALYVRDPISAERARGDALPVIETADLVFTAGTVDKAAPGRYLPDLEATDRLALVNASGLVDTAVHAYVGMIASLRAQGLRVAIIPHVSRPGADDLPLCRAIAVAYADDPGVTLIAQLLGPREIRGLGARAELTVTGRMHLAVMSMLAGTPSVTVATQGKVEGLMQLFGTPQLCVAPGDGFDSRLREAVERAVVDAATLRRAITRHLPDVVALAWRNVAGLGAAEAESRGFDKTPTPQSVGERDVA